MLGWSALEFSDWPVQWFIHPEDLKKTMEKVNRVQTIGTSVSFETRMKIKSQGFVWTDWSVWKSSDGVVYVLIIDVTERHLNEEFLELSNNDLQRFCMAVEYASDQILITDQMGKVIYANQAYQNVTGYSIDGIIGELVWSVWGNLMPRSFMMICGIN